MLEKCSHALLSYAPYTQLPGHELQAAITQGLQNAYLLLQIESIFQTIGACLMAIVNGIGAVLQAIIGAIVSLFDIIISCLTCGRGGGRRRRGTSAV